MSAQERHLPLSDSNKSPGRRARPLGAVEPEELVDITVLLRSRPSPTKASALDACADLLPAAHLTREEFASQYGARPEDVAAVETFAAEYGLVVVETSVAKRTVKLAGTVERVSEAFAVELTRETTDRGVVYRGRSGTVFVPEQMAAVVQGVFGLDDRPQASPHFRLANGVLARSPDTGFLPTEVAALYRFPRDVDGRGQTVAIIELGGGYRHDDLVRYFEEMGMVAPTVLAVPVDGAENLPTGSTDGPDAEVMLDIEVVGAVAPGARIVVYFAPNTSRGFLDAVLAAVHDDARMPSVLSISWGAAEVDWTSQSLHAMDEAFRAAALLGVTVCTASGDDGSSDGVDDGRTHVDFPASSPHVLACGGTRLEGSGTTERAWGGSGSLGASGGGVSDVFALPGWHGKLGVPNRIARTDRHRLLTRPSQRYAQTCGRAGSTATPPRRCWRPPGIARRSAANGPQASPRARWKSFACTRGV
jgi:kumamolisin